MKNRNRKVNARMNTFGINTGAFNAFLIGGVAVLAMMLAGCMSAEERRYVKLQQDGTTCANFGAGYGSRAHAECMLTQQQRRDRRQLLNMERARISSETARNNLEVLRLMEDRRRH
jgi:1,4-dihydroxy-2-naphthoyl-CoA synthase